jgi:hypothetical protein
VEFSEVIKRRKMIRGFTGEPSAIPIQVPHGYRGRDAATFQIVQGNVAAAGFSGLARRRRR